MSIKLELAIRAIQKACGRQVGVEVMGWDNAIAIFGPTTEVRLALAEVGLEACTESPGSINREGTADPVGVHKVLGERQLVVLSLT